MWYFHCIVKLEEVIIKRCKTLCCFVAKWGFQKAGLSYTVKPPVQPQVYRVSYKGIPLCLETQLQSNISIFWKYLATIKSYARPFGKYSFQQLEQLASHLLLERYRRTLNINHTV